jgi:hypothetical protein
MGSHFGSSVFGVRPILEAKQKKPSAKVVVRETMMWSHYNVRVGA